MTREEAIDIIRKNIPHLGIGATEMTAALNELVPELCESEDEKVIKALETFINQPEIAEKITFEARIMWLSWLERQKEQKPAWSEEDEKKMIFLERLIEYNVPDGQYGWADGRKGGFVTKSEVISILKSLHPDTFQNGNSRPKTSDNWKPSEEQMEALKEALETYKGFEEYDAMKSLYNDLKKLGVKEEPEYYQHFDPDC